MLGALTTSLVIAVVVLLLVLVWRERRAALLARAARQFEAIVREGRFADRIRDGGAATGLAAAANRLLEQIAIKNLLIS